MVDLLRHGYARIVAGCTVAAHDNRIMHKSAHEAIKGACLVAGRTVLAGGYMTGGLTHADIAVMAGQAVAAICAQVIKRRAGKTGGVMAIGTILVVGNGRYMVWQFAYANYIVVAGVTTTYERWSSMAKGAGGKGAGAMTNTTILGSRHVIERLTARINAMTGGAIVHDVGMVNERTSKGIGVMA